MPPEYADGEVVTYSRNNRFECSPLHIWWRQSRIHCQEHGSAHRVRSHLRAITEGGGGLQLQIASLLSPWSHYDYDRMYDGLQWSMVRQTSPIPERYAWNERFGGFVRLGRFGRFVRFDCRLWILANLLWPVSSWSWLMSRTANSHVIRSWQWMEESEVQNRNQNRNRNRDFPKIIPNRSFRQWLDSFDDPRSFIFILWRVYIQVCV